MYTGYTLLAQAFSSNKKETLKIVIFLLFFWLTATENWLKYVVCQQ